MSKPIQSKPIQSPQQPVSRIIKGTQTFWHDLFVSDVQTMKKNVSYKKVQPQIEHYEHKHTFHSHDRVGKPNKYTVPIGGHFHEIKVTTDENGKPKAVCGPALRKVQSKGKYGLQKTVIEPVTFEHPMRDGADAIETDTHTHLMEYKFSEELHPTTGAVPISDAPQVPHELRSEIKEI